MNAKDVGFVGKEGCCAAESHLSSLSQLRFNVLINVIIITMLSFDFQKIAKNEVRSANSEI